MTVWMPRAPPDSGYPLGWGSVCGVPSRTITRRLFLETLVTAFQLAA